MAKNWIQKTREKARSHYVRGKQLNELRKNPYKTGVKVMLPIIIVLLLIIIVGFFVIKAGAALLVGKKQAKEVEFKKGLIKDLWSKW